MTSDPNIEPAQVPDTGIVDPDVEPEQQPQQGLQQGAAPRADVASAPALQPRDSGGASDMLT
jgi:hypothetical protein